MVGVEDDAGAADAARSASRSRSRSFSRSRSRRADNGVANSSGSHHERRRSRSRSRSRRRRRSRSWSRSRSRERRRRRHSRSRSRGRHDSRRRRSSRSLDRYGGGGRSRSPRRGYRDRRSPSWARGRSRSWDRRRSRRESSRSRDRFGGRPPARRRRGRRGGRRHRRDAQRREQNGADEQQRRTEEEGESAADAQQSAKVSDDHQPMDADMPSGGDSDKPSPTAPQEKDGSHSPGSQDQENGSQHPEQNGERGGRRSVGRKSGKIPENWEDVPKIGDLVRDSRFVPMRCPLDDKYSHLYKSPEDAWSPRMFLEEQERRGLNVGLVIDLTNTFKYYDGAVEFQDSGVEYAKLKIEGFNAPPRDDDVNQFIAIVDAFLEKKPTARIAVHCTHGLNRTGYLIVQYLVKKLGCSVKHALGSFSLARPPGLIKHQYVETLYRLLGDGEEVELPVLPDWAAEKYGNRR